MCYLLVSFALGISMFVSTEARYKQASSIIQLPPHKPVPKTSHPTSTPSAFPTFNSTEIPEIPDNRLYSTSSTSFSYFGSSTAVDSASKSVVISAPGNGHLGSVFVFQANLDNKNNTFWEQKYAIKNPVRKAILPIPNNFGVSVAINSDFVFVGANTNYEPDSNYFSGCVYVYEPRLKNENISSLHPSQVLVPLNSLESASFGNVMKVSKNLLIVGSVGAVYVFKYNTETNEWQEDVKFQPSDSSTTFGGSIDIEELSANYDSNLQLGITPALATVGSSSQNDVGAVYIYLRTTAGNWVEDAVITPQVEMECFLFGTSLAMSRGTILIAAKTLGGGGVVYTYHRNSRNIWNLGSTLSPVEYVANFGHTIGFSKGLAVIGAPGVHDTYTGEVIVAGTAYLYSRASDTSEWMLVKEYASDVDVVKPKKTKKPLPITGSIAFDEFGISVLLFDGLLENTAIVTISAPTADGVEANTGDIYLDMVMKPDSYEETNRLLAEPSQSNVVEKFVFFSAKSFGIFAGILIAVVVPSATIAGVIVYRYRSSSGSNSYKKTNMQPITDGEEIELGGINPMATNGIKTGNKYDVLV